MSSPTIFEFIEIVFVELIMNYQVSGRTCQAWKENSPHAHWYHDQKENYCR